MMKYRVFALVIVGLVVGMVSVTEAVTVYLKDGTRLEVEKVVRMGDSVCLLVDISQIDTQRTEIEDVLEEEKTIQDGLVLTNVEFLPSDDNTEIIATGKVINQTEQAVKNLRVTAILMDKNDRVLLRAQSHVRPGNLAPHQTGTYNFQMKKPQGFWKASIEVQSEAQ